MAQKQESKALVQVEKASYKTKNNIFQFC